MKRIKVYHFHNGSGGGVFSIIKALLGYNHNALIENYVIYTINRDVVTNYKIHNLDGAKKEIIFNYSSNDNFYFTCKRLNKLIESDCAIIVAHDWLELGMVSNLGLNYPVLFLLHGDFKYYYDLAITHKNIIDTYACVSKIIVDKLQKLAKPLVPVVNLRYPVTSYQYSFLDTENLSCAYYVNDLSDERKQFKLLPIIDQLLLSKGVKITWHIAGGGCDIDLLKSTWLNYSEERIIYHGKLCDNQIFNFLKLSQIMILPSLAEGLPVSVVESMKVGLVPIVNDWQGAVSDLITNETGFIVKNNSTDEYARIIEYLHLDRIRLSVLSKKASAIANHQYDPFLNTSGFNDLVLNISNIIKKLNPQKIYGSRLDQAYLPNFITKNLRKCIYGR